MSFHFFAVFWRSNRGNIHYVSGGVGNNIFGGCFALLLFLILQQFEEIDQVQLYSVCGNNCNLWLSQERNSRKLLFFRRLDKRKQKSFFL